MALLSRDTHRYAGPHVGGMMNRMVAVLVAFSSADTYHMSTDTREEPEMRYTWVAPGMGEKKLWPALLLS
jgi:hypothetical protein